MHPDALEVVPDADEAARLEAQEQDDDEAIENALDLVHARREQCFGAAAEHAEEKAHRFRQQHDEDRAEDDAEQKFALETRKVLDNKACECGAILRGVKRPQDCKIFGTVCTPETPVGSCMVSNEGACAAHYAYGRFRGIEVKVEA